MAKKKKRKYFFDSALFLAVMFLIGFGLVMLYSASSYTAQAQDEASTYYIQRQAGFVVFGFFCMMVAYRVDYHIYYRLANLIFWFGNGLVLLTFLIGMSGNGSTRWLNIGGVSLQPSEVAKITVVLFVASKIVKKREVLDLSENPFHAFRYLVRGRWANLISMMHQYDIVLMAAIPIVLIAKNNLSSGLIIAGMVFVMLFVASRKYKPFVICMGMVAGVWIFAYPFAKFLEMFHILQDYQLRRIFQWKDPASYSEFTYQTLQGLYAIGSGGLFGKGLGESVQKFLMPEAQNDMIFSIICEELGMFGAVSIIIFYLFIIYRLMIIANSAKDLYGSMIVIGIMAQIGIQVIFNIAVVTNSMPNTGVSLPFISYGGSSLVLLMIEIGIALNVARQIQT